VATRKAIEQAIMSQPESVTVMVTDGKGELLASRYGTKTHSAILVVLDDLVKRGAEGGYSMRLSDSRKIKRAIQYRRQSGPFAPQPARSF